MQLPASHLCDVKTGRYGSRFMYMYMSEIPYDPTSPTSRNCISDESHPESRGACAPSSLLKDI